MIALLFVVALVQQMCADKFFRSAVLVLLIPFGLAVVVIVLLSVAFGAWSS